MDIPEAKVHSFVVKLWLEENGDEPDRIEWHGHITHVPDGERLYLKRLGDVTSFVERYLEEMGVEPRAQPGVRGCLRRLNFKLTRRH